MSIRVDNNSTTGRPSYSQTNDTNEQTVFTSSITKPRIFMCYLDLTNLTQNSTIRFKVAVDGTNFISFPPQPGLNHNPYAFVVLDDLDGVWFGPIYVADQVRVTIQAGGVEGAARAIPYHMLEEVFD